MYNILFYIKYAHNKLNDKMVYMQVSDFFKDTILQSPCICTSDQSLLSPTPYFVSKHPIPSKIEICYGFHVVSHVVLTWVQQPKVKSSMLSRSRKSTNTTRSHASLLLLE